ncbi:LysR family transcriptional regulator [Nannocystaceae bacterium ST9]
MDGLKTDLNQLVIFAKVVETRSFTAAGRALGLPKSTISRKVAQLEERLGVQLLQRTTRRIALTESGAAFHEHCVRITADIAEAERAVGREVGRPHGLLRIAASRELGPRFLAASVNAFLAEHADVDIELSLGGSSLDPGAEGLDLALRLDRRIEGDVLVRELGPLRRGVVASPRYLAERGRGVEALGDHAWIATREAINREGPVSGPRPRLVVDDLGMLREALLAGLGVGVLPIHECLTDLDEGKLVWLARAGERDDLEICAIHPSSRQLSTKVRSFVEFLAERLAQVVESSESVSPLSESDSDSIGSALYSGHDSGAGDSATQP